MALPSWLPAPGLNPGVTSTVGWSGAPLYAVVPDVPVVGWRRGARHSSCHWWRWRSGWWCRLRGESRRRPFSPAARPARAGVRCDWRGAAGEAPGLSGLLPFQRGNVLLGEPVDLRTIEDVRRTLSQLELRHLALPHAFDERCVLARQQLGAGCASIRVGDAKGARVHARVVCIEPHEAVLHELER